MERLNLFLLQEKESLASIMARNSLRNTDVNLDKYTYRPHINNSSKKQNKREDKDKRTGQHGIVYRGPYEIKQEVENRRKKMSPERLEEELSKIDNIGYGDIFYAPVRNSDSEDYKKRPMIVFPKDFNSPDGKSIYAVPLIGDHSSEGEPKKKAYWYLSLPFPIDSVEVTDSNGEAKTISKIKDPFYADIGVFRHNILEGKPQFAVKRDDIITVKSHASDDTLDALINKRDAIEREKTRRR